MTSSATKPGLRSASVDAVLSSPIVGFLPWIAVSLINGPGRFGLSTAIAAAMAAAIVLLDVFRGKNVKWFGLFDVIFFSALFAISFDLSTAHRHWLENWFGEIANILLALIAAASMLVRRPFTLAYAKDVTPREVWDTAGFKRVNYVITGAWTLAFVVCSIIGWYGDAVLHNSNNIWTGWILQTGVFVLAMRFTDWYPDRVQNNVAPPTLSSLLVVVSGWLVPVGVLSLIFDAAPTWVGIALIVAGAGLSKVLVQSDSATAAA